MLWVVLDLKGGLQCQVPCVHVRKAYPLWCQDWRRHRWLGLGAAEVEGGAGSLPGQEPEDVRRQWPLKRFPWTDGERHRLDVRSLRLRT